MYVIPELRGNRFIDVPLRSAAEVFHSWRGRLSDTVPSGKFSGEEPGAPVAVSKLDVLRNAELENLNELAQAEAANRDSQ